MKRIILTIAAIIAFAFTASAQKWYAGGGAGLELVFENNGKANGGEFGLTINPEIGYNINEKFAVGAAVALGFETEWKTGVAAQPAFIFSFDPYFRWNFLRLGDKFNLFADAAASFGCKGQAFAYGLAIKPGLSYAFSDRLSLVTHFASLGFKGKGSKIEYGLGVMIDSSVGLYWNF
ncbi:MAG: hypothetical protein MJY49_05940 [Bacteroidales bacterium]|nr:hypothetical protein [Bacteroidales bacterium]